MGVFVDNRPGLAIERVSRRGGVPEWLKGTDCKSVGARLRWFESNPLHSAKYYDISSGCRSFGSYDDGRNRLACAGFCAGLGAEIGHCVVQVVGHHMGVAHG